MATSPKWNYRGANFGWVPDMSANLNKKLTILLGNNRDSARFILAVHTHHYIYKIHKSEKSNQPNGQPTPSERKAAAKIILRDSQKLFSKISDQAGGIKPDLDYGLYEKMQYLTPLFRLHDMEMALEGLMKGCQLFLEETYPEMKTVGITPEKVFAFRVASLFRNILKEEPKKYTPEELSITTSKYKCKGIYARVLAACFIDSDEYSPGNLQEIVLWGVDFTPDN